jgi:hypothetical protein
VIKVARLEIVSGHHHGNEEDQFAEAKGIEVELFLRASG